MGETGKTSQSIAAWLEAGRTLANDPSARVVCPNCGLGILKVSDVSIWNGSRVERWMRCDYCGTANTMLMTSAHATGQDPAEPKHEPTRCCSDKPVLQTDDPSLVDQLVVDAVKANRETK